MGMFSRADEDWAGCDSGADYFFANIYREEPRKKSIEEIKREEIKKYLDKLDGDRRSRFVMRYSERKGVFDSKRIKKENMRFLNHIESFGTHISYEAIRELYPNRKDKFSVALYEKGFSILYGSLYPNVGDPIHTQGIIVEMPEYINYVTIDIVYRKHKNHRLCIPTESYNVVAPIRKFINHKKYEITGYRFLKFNILRLSDCLASVCKDYDEVPSLFVHKVG